jgi:hypothetical protein
VFYLPSFSFLSFSQRSGRGSESLRIHKKINSGLTMVSLDSLFEAAGSTDKDNRDSQETTLVRPLKDASGTQTVSGKFSSKLTGFGGRPDSLKVRNE